MNARRFLQFLLKAYRPVQQRGLWMDGVLPPRHVAPTRGARVKIRRSAARPAITSIRQKEALA